MPRFRIKRKDLRIILHFNVTNIKGIVIFIIIVIHNKSDEVHEIQSIKKFTWLYVIKFLKLMNA